MKMLLEFDFRKATQAINYLATREGGQIGKLKLIKLAYLADRFHIRRYGRPIFNDSYLAMQYGPVGSSVKDIAELSSFLGPEERKYAARFLEKGKAENTVRTHGPEKWMCSQTAKWKPFNLPTTSSADSRPEPWSIWLTATRSGRSTKAPLVVAHRAWRCPMPTSSKIPPRTVSTSSPSTPRFWKPPAKSSRNSQRSPVSGSGPSTSGLSALARRIQPSEPLNLPACRLILVRPMWISFAALPGGRARRSARWPSTPIAMCSKQRRSPTSRTKRWQRASLFCCPSWVQV